MEIRKNLLQVLGDWLAERQAAAPVSSRRGPRAGDLVRWFLPNGGTLLLVALLIATQSLWARPAAAPNVPGPSATTVNYQGRLADSSGVPITGTRGMTFALYDALTGGNLIWGPESHTAVPVSEGLFSVGLGSQTSGGIPTSAWNGDRYLEITVGGETLAPRELLRSVPIAGMALTVPDGAVTSAKVALTHDEIYGSGTVLGLTTTPQVVPDLSVSVNPATNQIMQLYVTLDIAKSGNCGTVLANIHVDGTPVGPLMTLGGATDIRSSIATVRQISLSTGSHIINIRAYCETGSGGVVMTGQSSLSYTLFSQ